MKHASKYALQPLALSLALFSSSVSQEVTSHSAADDKDVISFVRRGALPKDKLDVYLNMLVNQFSTTRGDAPVARFDAKTLEETFGISSTDKRPSVEVAIKVKEGTDPKSLEKAGAMIKFTLGETIYATVPVSDLERVAREQSVLSVGSLRMTSVPAPPADPATPEVSAVTRSRKEPEQFDNQGQTGKGVIIGIVDTGIDWKHPDFLKADGTTRILALYDMIDDSWSESSMSVGSEPPYTMDNAPLGTLYTNQQINDALKGKGTVNSKDIHGHGTACAGTAAGNGRAPGAYKGVAPDADLIIVKAGDGNFKLTEYAAQWILGQAKTMGKPCVVSMSLGSQWSAHDGNTAQEDLLNKLVGKGKPGAAICVAAGNERSHSFHAGGKFGPDREGQADRFSASIEVIVSEFTYLYIYFDQRDDWAMGIQGKDKFLVGPGGTPINLFIWKNGTNLTGQAEMNRTAHGGSLGVWKGEGAAPANAKEYLLNYVFENSNTQTLSELVLPLPPGQYVTWGYGGSSKVPNGRFDLYLPMTRTASFGKGVDHQYMVGTPGNASNVITVGAYDFRNTWKNLSGRYTYYNLKPGELSNYSNPGYCRDGRVKPDVTGPATYTISSLARIDGRTYASMGMGNSGPDSLRVTQDGYHVAWSGTSASTPYVAGVVALMLQKNPSLDAHQIKDILTTNADKDEFTAGVPNRDWGYGKVNPARAIRMTK